MILRAVDAESPPVPEGDFLAHGLRRPGELHEAIAVPREILNAFARKAKTSRIPTALAATVLVELVLLERELTSAGVALNAPPRPAVALRLSTAEARYLCGLTWRRPGARSTGGGPVALPIRLMSRADIRTLTEAATGDLELALAWEAAAVTSGKTIGELGLSVALRTVTQN
jgi:hypothetical protein